MCALCVACSNAGLRVCVVSVCTLQIDWHWRERERERAYIERNHDDHPCVITKSKLHCKMAAQWTKVADDRLERELEGSEYIVNLTDVHNSGNVSVQGMA